MKYISSLQRGHLIALAIALGCVAASSGDSIRRTAAVANDVVAQSKESFKASVRDGVGSEVQFAKAGDDAKNVRASVESAVQFMRRRSGVDLRGQTKTRLADMEASALAGASRRITPEELSEIIAATALERISVASDDEINRAAETLKGFDAPDLPDSFRRGRTQVRLRSSLASGMSEEKFVSSVKAIRDANSIIKDTLLKPVATRMAANEVQACARNLSEAVPEQFGNASTGLTPLQAVLIAYSVVSEDRLAYSAANLQKRMQFLQEAVTKTIGRPYPSPNGHFAYGPNGYLVSTPLDICFDEQTVNLLLNHIAERSAIQ